MQGLSSFSSKVSTPLGVRTLHFSGKENDKKTAGEKVIAHGAGVVYGAVTGDRSKEGMKQAGDTWTKISGEADKKAGPLLDKVFGSRK